MQIASSMPLLAWIILGGLAMSAVALVGGLTLLLPENLYRRLTLPLVAFAAGALLGGALFHLLPNAIDVTGNTIMTHAAVAGGIVAFLCLELVLNWHHCHRSPERHERPLTYLILIADGVHNFIGGLAVAGAALVDLRLGIVTWLAAAAHELPQELGDFGILIHGGWSPRRALVYNLLSGLTFLLGGLVAYFARAAIEVAYLVPFAAGNFLYIAVADLLPEVNRVDKLGRGLVHLGAFLLGLLVLYLLRGLVEV
ncbi:MAG: ZIP family metal transporter [Enhygromyxa sp.]